MKDSINEVERNAFMENDQETLQLINQLTTSFEDQIEDLQGKLEELQNELKEAEETIENLQEEIGQQDKEIERLQNLMDQARDLLGE
jgi:peptidoglycan hydrolase CwlO-like protein